MGNQALKKARLNPRQKKLVKNLLQGKTLAEAAIAAGYSAASAASGGQQAFSLIREKMPDLMDRIGLTDSRLLHKYLVPALEATETKFFQHEGMVTDQRDVIAWSPRLEALDKAFRLKGSYAADNEKSSSANIGLKIVVEHLGNTYQIAAEAKPVVELLGHTETN